MIWQLISAFIYLLQNFFESNFDLDSRFSSQPSSITEQTQDFVALTPFCKVVVCYSTVDIEIAYEGFIGSTLCYCL